MKGQIKVNKWKLNVWRWKSTKFPLQSPLHPPISSQAKSSPSTAKANPDRVLLGTTTKGNPWCAGTAKIVPSDLEHQDLDDEDLSSPKWTTLKPSNSIHISLGAAGGKTHNRTPQVNPYLNLQSWSGSRRTPNQREENAATPSITTTILLQKLPPFWKGRKLFK